MRWWAAAIAVAACRPAGRAERTPRGLEAEGVPEHHELGTLPVSALPPIATEIGNGQLAEPETVIHDVDDDVYLVSNIRGNPNAEDDNGFIAKVSPMGAVIDPFFIDGRDPNITLHAPRGMALGGDTLYVADEGGVRLFDRKTGAPKGSWSVPGSRFLNGVAIDSRGEVLVTDTGIDILPAGPVKTGPYVIYRFDANGHASVLAQGDELHGPNGIVAGPQGIFVVEFMDDEHGVFSIDETGTKQLLGRLPFGELDGLVRLSDGSMLVSSWLANGVYRFVPGEPPALVIEHLTTPAGIGYDVTRNRILIPELLGQAVRFETWAPPSAHGAARGTP